MMTDITSPVGDAAETELFLGADWFDPLEAGVRTRIRSFIEELLEAEKSFWRRNSRRRCRASATRGGARLRTGPTAKRRGLRSWAIATAIGNGP
jgi:hypothetical protein